MVYLCTSEEERVHKQRVFSFFFDRKNGFTSDIEKSTLLRKIFLGVCGKFLRNVGVRGGDSEVFWNLK